MLPVKLKHSHTEIGSQFSAKICIGLSVKKLTMSTKVMEKYKKDGTVYFPYPEKRKHPHQDDIKIEPENKLKKVHEDEDEAEQNDPSTKLFQGTNDKENRICLSKAVKGWILSRYRPIREKNELNAIDLKEIVGLMDDEVTKTSKSLCKNWTVPGYACAFLGSLEPNAQGACLIEEKLVYLSKDIEHWIPQTYRPTSNENFELSAVGLKEIVKLMNEEVAKTAASFRENWVVPIDACAFLGSLSQHKK